MSLYSRVSSFSLKKETTANVGITPDAFFGANDEDINIDYQYVTATPIKNNRALNINAVDNVITPPTGTINLNVEPKLFGHFIEGIFGLTSGTYIKISSVSGTFDTTNALAFAPSGASADVDYVGDDYLIISNISGTITESDGITQAVSGITANVDNYASTVYAHAGIAPSELSDTYSLQINYADSAIRYIGTRFIGIDSLAQSDNIITAGIQVKAQGQFRQGRVTAITSAASGAQTITVDQTYGLVAGDSIKLYRPGTGFLDFSAASTKTHTIASITDETNLVVTNLETATAVGDLILLAPQTATYTVGDEFTWIGGSTATVGTDIDNLAVACLEDFTAVMTNDFEERYCANGNDFEDRFPGKLLQKGFTANGTFLVNYDDEDFYRHLRNNTDQALEIKTTGSLIGSTGIKNELRVTYSKIQFDNYQTNISNDDLVDEDIPFTSFYDDDQGWSVRVLLINDVASY